MYIINDSLYNSDFVTFTLIITLLINFFKSAGAVI